MRRSARIRAQLGAPPPPPSPCQSSEAGVPTSGPAQPEGPVTGSGISRPPRTAPALQLLSDSGVPSPQRSVSPPPTGSVAGIPKPGNESDSLSRLHDIDIEISSIDAEIEKLTHKKQGLILKRNQQREKKPDQSFILPCPGEGKGGLGEYCPVKNLCSYCENCQVCGHCTTECPGYINITLPPGHASDLPTSKTPVPQKPNPSQVLRLPEMWKDPKTGKWVSIYFYLINL